ncbi:hypothetical protein H5410_021842 [Solanum commersonii]|uniref:Uncharacterized protein n=1 Tax=Solanum commersonii TaxID=4109 RepID=A0A9J5ZCH9_SOLCO|nr:hypothetical protein H5410_021842 [Solanum commersonii]
MKLVISMQILGIAFLGAERPSGRFSSNFTRSLENVRTSNSHYVSQTSFGGLLMHIKNVMRNFSSQDTRIKVPLQKSTIQHDVASSKSSHLDECFGNCSVPPSNFDNVCYTPGYWEWVEDVLLCHKEILELIKDYDALYTSLFTYNYDDNVLHAFFKLLCLSTNMLSNFIGVMSISLWDLKSIGDLHVQG